MPRVNSVTKNKAGADIQCGHCGVKIKPGRKYLHWSFRYGGKRIRCDKPSCRPRQSDLTMSKMSGAYSAIEGVEDVLVSVRTNKEKPDVLASALDSAADEIESVRDEYQDSLDNMPENFQQGQTGEEIQEKIDALDEFANTLRDASSTLTDELEPVEGESDDDKTKRIDDAIQTAEDSLSEFSL